MDQRNALCEMQDILLNYETQTDKTAKDLISVIRSNCKTYAEADEVLDKITQRIAWQGKKNCLPLFERARWLLEKEKGRLPLADDPSS